MDDRKQHRVFETLIRGAQGNFDHLMGQLKRIARYLNNQQDQIDRLYDTVNEVQQSAGGGGGAPTDADYLVGTAQGGLSAEIVVGASPGGELGGTWASPTVDSTHSGSAHHTEDHDHDGSPTAKLIQANTHESPDTDSATSSLHHTIGSTSTTAAAGNHTHSDSDGGGAGTVLHNVGRARVLWFRGDDPFMQEKYADAAAVERWPNMGHGPFGTANARDTTTTHRPTYKTNIVNGVDIVRFDGSDDGLLVAGGSGNTGYRGFIRPEDNGGITVCVVAESDVNNVAKTVFAYGGSGATNYTWDFGLTSAGKLYFNQYLLAGGANTSAVHGTVITTGQFYIFVGRIYNLVGPANATTMTSETKVWLNGGTGVADTTNFSTSTGSEGHIGIGFRPDAARFWDGDIAEVMLWRRPLAHSELDTLLTYLGTKYSITVTACS